MFCTALAERIIFITADHKISSLRWRPSLQDMAFTMETQPEMAAQLEVPLESAVESVAGCLASAVVGKDRQHLVIGSCGHWDSTWRLHVLGRDGAIRGMLTHVVAHHKNLVTAIAIVPATGGGRGETSRVHVVTGSKDTTVMLWEVDVTSRQPPAQPKHILFGHDDEVTAVAVDRELDAVASCSLDGTCILHSLRSGTYTLTIRPAGAESLLTRIAISQQGYIIVYSRSDLRLHLYSINGRTLGSMDIVSPIRAMLVTEDTFFLVTGDDRGNVCVRHVHNLEPITKTPFNLPAMVIDGKRSLSTKAPTPQSAGNSMLQCVSVGPGKHQEYIVAAFSGFGLVAARLMDHQEPGPGR